MKTLEQTDALSLKDKELLEEVKIRILRFLSSAEIVLYGSVARGTQGPESDYDVLVLTKETLTSNQEGEIRDALFDLEMTTGAALTTLFYSEEEWQTPVSRVSPFRHEVQRDGIVL